MCTPRDAGANGKEIRSISDKQWENWRPQYGAFGGLLASLPIMRLAGAMKTPAPLSDGI